MGTPPKEENKYQARKKPPIKIGGKHNPKGII